MLLSFSIILVSCYFLGSIPTGFLIAKYLKNIDLRDIGSGSTGATNVLRNVGKWPALFVFIIDLLKGFIAVKLASSLTEDILIIILAGLLSIAGHIWPIWLKGEGGKAVATGLGMFLALNWKVGLASLGVFLVIFSKFRIVSLSSIIAAIFLPILMYLDLGNHPYIIISLIVAILVLFKHRSNIQRLLKGTEPKINSKN